MIFSFVGALIVLAGHIVAGNRLHWWLYYHTGWIFPTDAGAWCGLALGLYLLFF